MKYYCWASDVEENTGEGKLARLFLKDFHFFNKERVNCFSNSGRYIFIKNKLKKINYKKNPSNNFYNNYIKIFFGIIILWYYYLKKKKDNLFKLPSIMEFPNICFVASKNNIGPNNRKPKKKK